MNRLYMETITLSSFHSLNPNVDFVLQAGRPVGRGGARRGRLQRDLPGQD